ncbi:PhzF family phenazine biosynthesis protein [Nonomuraea sp. NPDC002799]
MKIFVVDAFASRAFGGNPAGVCLLDRPRDPRWMQSVASELNLSETAFVDRSAGGDGIGLRWFTPGGEVDLCGHATLAAAHVLWEREGEPRARLRFRTRSGVLETERGADGIRLDLPAEPPEPIEEPAGLAAALGARPVWTGRNRFDYLVELAGEAEVAALEPDFAALAAFPVRGVIVTAGRSSGEPGGHDFVSRFFAPRHGVNEDPVTGSAHCCLGPFWGARLGRSDLLGHQISPRGGRVRVTLLGDRVALDGRAVIFMSGELHDQEEQ